MNNAKGDEELLSLSTDQKAEVIFQSDFSCTITGSCVYSD